MGFAGVVPADGLVTVTLTCGECGRSETWPTPYYSDRIRVLSQARRLGWGWFPDHRRRCPVCQAIATRFGRWGSLAHELRPGFVHGCAHQSGLDSSDSVTPVLAAPAVQELAPPPGQAIVPLRAVPTTLQLDLFSI